MREQFGPRWAFLTGTGPVTVGVGRMFAVFSEAEGLDVGMFADEDEALRWLTEARPEPRLRPAEVGVGRARVGVSPQHPQEFWQEVLDDPSMSAGNRRHAEWKLESFRRADQGEPPLSVPEELRDPASPDWSSHLYFIEHPYEELESWLARNGPMKCADRDAPSALPPLSPLAGQGLAAEAAASTPGPWLPVLPLHELPEAIPGLVSVD